MDRCKSTADVVNNVENPSTFIFSFVILAISNQSFRTIICVAVEKLNKTYAHVTGSSSHLTQSWQPLLAGLLSGDYRCSTKKVCTGYKQEQAPQAVLVVNSGFILREKSRFSISCVLVPNTCKAESIHFVTNATKRSRTSLFQVFTFLLFNESHYYCKALSLLYLQMLNYAVFRSTDKIFMLNICTLITI